MSGNNGCPNDENDYETGVLDGGTAMSTSLRSLVEACERNARKEILVELRRLDCVAAEKDAAFLLEQMADQKADYENQIASLNKIIGRLRDPEPIIDGPFRRLATAGRRVMSDERIRRIGQTVGELRVAAESARACGLTRDEVVTLLDIQFRNCQEMAACACGVRWTQGDLDENPNAPTEHECGVAVQLARVAAENPEAVRLAAQLLGVPPCPKCDHVMRPGHVCDSQVRQRVGVLDARYPDLYVGRRVRVACGTREGAVVEYESGAGKPWHVRWDGLTVRHAPERDSHLGYELVPMRSPGEHHCPDCGGPCKGHLACTHPPGSGRCEVCSLLPGDTTSAQAVAKRARAGSQD
jgi:hypothetical protein